MTRIDRSVVVTDSSAVSEARRIVTQAAVAAGLGVTDTARAALVATELSTNLLKHGDGGTLLIGSADAGGQSLTLIAADRGKGIANITAAMRDGYSTAGSHGTGLGAIQRSSTFFDVYSHPERGTVVLCRIEGEEQRRPPLAAVSFMIGGICIPKRGEEESGDAWTVTAERDSVTVAVADGLGHGLNAATAARAAVRVFRERPGGELERMMEDAHGALRSTRGAAVGLARIHAAHLEFAGVGNIAAAILTEEGSRRAVSLNGIVGHEMRKVQKYSYPWSRHAMLVMQSDGVSSNWNLAAYPGLTQHHAALIAAVIHRDHCRGTDDATVVVVKGL